MAVHGTNKMISCREVTIKTQIMKILVGIQRSQKHYDDGWLLCYSSGLPSIYCSSSLWVTAVGLQSETWNSSTNHVHSSNFRGVVREWDTAFSCPRSGRNITLPSSEVLFLETWRNITMPCARQEVSAYFECYAPNIAMCS